MEVQNANRPCVMGVTHTVAAGHYMSAQAGLQMLEAGGNAIDAGVAAGIATGVLEGIHVSIGRVAPILIWLAERGEAVTISGLGSRPKKASAEYLQKHHGVPPAPPQPWADLPKVLELAKRPNAVIKVSGACTLFREPHPFPDIWDPLARVFDACWMPEGLVQDPFVVGASGKVQCLFACGVTQRPRRRGQRMAADYSICLGTAGWGVWHSPDAGKSWIRHRAPFPLNSRIQALVAHPTEAHTVLAGGDTGLFVSRDGGARWERIGANGAVPTIWSLAIDPVDPDILFAGTRPAGVYRSRDGGLQWEKLAVDIARECSIGIPFVTGIVVDPDDHRIVWAGVEIDGVFRSLDGGDTWTHLETGLYDPDIHAVTIAATSPKRLYASTAREVFTSNDLGETWQPMGIKEKWPLPYARGIMVKADDPGVLFAGCGETTTGEKGHVLRTTNFGETWEILPLPTQPNATVWGLATHPADANRIVAFSLFGEVYVTEDAGASWRKIAREFGEIRAAVWVPN